MENLSRRDFFKLTGAGAVAAGLAGSAIAGHANGADPTTWGSWEKEMLGERFNRKPFEVDTPPYRVLGRTRAVEYLSPTQNRRGEAALRPHFNVPDGMTVADYIRPRVNMNDFGATPLTVIDHPTRGAELRNFYQRLRDEDGYDVWAEDLYHLFVILPRQPRINNETVYERLLVAAFNNAIATHNNHYASRVTSLQSDFDGVNQTQYPVLNPANMSRLIKKMGYLFGAPIVRIARLNHDFAYETHPGGRGYARGERVIPQPHWQYAIVMGHPMTWDGLDGAPLWGSSSHGYGQIGMTAGRMAAFVKSLGYPARPNDPASRYEYVMPPILVDAGVGEQGRMGIVITPEFGPNFRPGIVVTNLPLEPDKPVDLGIKKFCENCMICADHCPTGAITRGGVKNISGRGYEGWQVHIGKCHNSWQTVPGNGCLVCISVCPFSQKSNWLHKTARNIAVRDRTGLSHRALVWMEKTFYGTNPPEHYHYVEGSRDMSGVVKGQPWFFKTEDFLGRA
ncbi:MAG: reductive dehalogenase [Treponema sp.]|nr:reductive dehalogenase [Treponema sp.]